MAWQNYTHTFNIQPMLDWISDKEQFQNLSSPPRLDAEERAKFLSETAQRLKFKILQPWMKAGIGFDEAFFLGMYRPDIDEADLARYVGKHRQKKIHFGCNDLAWYATANDKALYYTLLQGAGIAVPKAIAFACARRREGLGEWLGTPEAFAEFFASNKIWPIFIKPVDGSFSIGAMKLTGFDGEMLSVADDDPVRVPELWHYMQELSPKGYLIQSCLQPSQFAKQNFGDVIATVRMLILFSGPEPQVESAVLKIPSGSHVADNFWRPGNMLAAIDEEGRFGRVITGKGSQQQLVTSHPTTGASFVGMQLPDWKLLCDTALKAAGIFYGIRTQSWDVALTENGPHLIEINFGGDLDLHQIAHQRGILSPNYVAHLQNCGVKLRGL